MTKEYCINFKTLKSLRKHAIKAQKKNYMEVCGLIIVDKENFLNLEYLENLCDKPGRFEFSIDEIESNRKKAQTIGNRICGTFHSHPLSEAIPGKGDLKDARINSLMMIHDVCDNDTKLWRVCKNSKGKYAKELSLRIRGQIRGQ